MVAERIAVAQTIGEGVSNQNSLSVRWQDLGLVEEFVSVAEEKRGARDHKKDLVVIENGTSWRIYDVILAAQRLKTDLEFRGRKMSLRRGVKVHADHISVPGQTIQDMKAITRLARKVLFDL